MTPEHEDAIAAACDYVPLELAEQIVASILAALGEPETEYGAGLDATYGAGSRWQAEQDARSLKLHYDRDVPIVERLVWRSVWRPVEDQ